MTVTMTEPTRTVRLIRRPVAGLPGVLRVTVRNRPRDYRLEELGWHDGRAWRLEPLADEHSDTVQTYWVAADYRSGDWYSTPEDGDGGELLCAIRALVEAGEL